MLLCAVLFFVSCGLRDPERHQPGEVVPAPVSDAAVPVVPESPTTVPPATLEAAIPKFPESMGIPEPGITQPIPEPSATPAMSPIPTPIPLSGELLEKLTHAIEPIAFRATLNEISVVTDVVWSAADLVQLARIHARLRRVSCTEVERVILIKDPAAQTALVELQDPDCLSHLEEPGLLLCIKQQSGEGMMGARCAESLVDHGSAKGFSTALLYCSQVSVGELTRNCRLKIIKRAVVAESLSAPDLEHLFRVANDMGSPELLARIVRQLESLPLYFQMAGNPPGVASFARFAFEKSLNPDVWTAVLDFWSKTGIPPDADRDTIAIGRMKSSANYAERVLSLVMAGQIALVSKQNWLALASYLEEAHSQALLRQTLLALAFNPFRLKTHVDLILRNVYRTRWGGEALATELLVGLLEEHSLDPHRVRSYLALTEFETVERIFRNLSFLKLGTDELSTYRANLLRLGPVVLQLNLILDRLDSVSSEDGHSRLLKEAI